MTVVDVTAPSGAVIRTCTVHLMAPCPCRRCNGRGTFYPADYCPRCGGDGLDPEVREDCEEEL